MSTQYISITSGYLKEIEYAFAIGNTVPTNNLLRDIFNGEHILICTNKQLA
jgi:hypothetical protein